MTLTTDIPYDDDEPDDPVLAVLEELAAADTDFDFGSMAQQWRRRGALTPRQMSLVAWRLKVHGIEHRPGDFRVTDGEEDQLAIREMSDWKRSQLGPYLSARQRRDFGT
jgi:hypothetical protein